MISLRIDPAYKPLDLEQILQDAAAAALRQQGLAAEVELTLVLTSDAQVQKLNRRFRGENLPTDVLSFPEDENDPENGQRYLGDVVISLPRARAQAETGGHSLQAELQLLAVHGVLHLLGHDHADEAQRGAMWAAQDATLAALGSPLRSVEAEAQAQARH